MEGQQRGTEPKKVRTDLRTAYQQLGFPTAVTGDAALQDWNPSLGQKELVSIWVRLADAMAWFDTSRSQQVHELVQPSRRGFRRIGSDGAGDCTRRNRGKVGKFKDWFYHIAVGAKVPVVLGFCDYAKKEAGFGPVIEPTGDIDSQLPEIQEYFRGIPGKNPQLGM